MILIYEIYFYVETLPIFFRLIYYELDCSRISVILVIKVNINSLINFDYLINYYS